MGLGSKLMFRAARKTYFIFPVVPLGLLVSSFVMALTALRKVRRLSERTA
jgi:hypothetical protein